MAMVPPVIRSAMTSIQLMTKVGRMPSAKQVRAVSIMPRRMDQSTSCIFCTG